MANRYISINQARMGLSPFGMDYTDAMMSNMDNQERLDKQGIRSKGDIKFTTDMMEDEGGFGYVGYNKKQKRKKRLTKLLQKKKDKGIKPSSLKVNEKSIEFEEKGKRKKMIYKKKAGRVKKFKK